MTHAKIIAAAVLLLISVASADPATGPAGESRRTTPSGLTIVDVASGSGTAQKGDIVLVHYTGRLQSNGKKFDSSLDHPDRQPMQLKLGAGSVIKGWEEGIVGMKVGDKRQLIIPPSLGYGDKAQGDDIPANSTLVFDIELVGLVHIAAQ